MCIRDSSKGCANPNEVVRWFTSTGILLCILTSSSTTSGFTGALVGIQHFVPRYSASGTGIINSQIYDNSGATVIIGTGITVATPTRLEVKNGGILVDDIVVGRGTNRVIWNTAIGQWALVLASGMNNTVLWLSLIHI